jgi:hypothetical protein
VAYQSSSDVDSDRKVYKRKNPQCPQLSNLSVFLVNLKSSSRIDGQPSDWILKAKVSSPIPWKRLNGNPSFSATIFIEQNGYALDGKAVTEKSKGKLRPLAELCDRPKAKSFSSFFYTFQIFYIDQFSKSVIPRPLADNFAVSQRKIPVYIIMSSASKCINRTLHDVQGVSKGLPTFVLPLSSKFLGGAYNFNPDRLKMRFWSLCGYVKKGNLEGNK